MLNIGLQSDSARTERSNKSFERAKNIVLDSLRKIAKNEDGFNIIAQLNGNIVGGISLPESVLVFTIEGTSPIYLNIYTVTDAGATLQLHTQYTDHVAANWIEGVYTYNRTKDLIIAFWNDVETTSEKVCYLNITTLPSTTECQFPSGLTAGKELNVPSEIGLIYLTPDIKPPIFDLISTDDNGYLESGVYFVAVAYKYEDESYTSASYLSNPIPITNESVTADINDYDGCAPLTQCYKSFTIQIDNLDTRFKYFKLIIIGKNNGLITSKETVDYKISSSTAKITYTGDGVTSDTNDALIDTLAIEKAYAGDINEDRLLLAKIMVATDFNYQRWANCIEVNWVRDVHVGLDDTQNSYKDGVVLFDTKGFMPGEVYALFFHWIIGGRLTKGFHIPGRIAEAFGGYDEDTLLTDMVGGVSLDEREINPEVKLYHIRMQQGTPTNMGFWENMDEVYPATETNDFKGTLSDGVLPLKDDSGAVILNSNNIVGQKVRHHKFPDVYEIKDDEKYLYLRSDLSLTSYTVGTGTMDTQLSQTRVNSFVFREVGAADITSHNVVRKFFEMTNSVYTTDAFQSLRLLYKDIPTTTDENSYLNVHCIKKLLLGDKHAFFSPTNALGITNGFNAANATAYKALTDGVATIVITDSELVGTVLGVGDVTDGDLAGYGYIYNALIKITTPVADLGFDYTTVVLGGFTTPIVAEERKHENQTFGTILTCDIDGTYTTPINAGESIMLVRFGVGPDTCFVCTGSDPTMTITLAKSTDNNTMFTKPLGIKLSNIFIPTDIRNKVQGWAVSFAKRDLNDATIIGQSAIFDNSNIRGDITSGAFRTHPFDMMHGEKLKVNPRFMRTQCIAWYADATYTTKIDTQYILPFVDPDRTRLISDSKFLVANNDATNPTNNLREECVYGVIDNIIPPAPIANYLIISDLMMFKRNVYMNFFNQLLVMTGKIHTIATANIDVNGYYTNLATAPYSASNYGGDVVTNIYGVRMTTDSSPTVDYYHTFITNSIAHSGLRHDSIIDDKLYYPKYPQASFDAIAAAGSVDIGEVDQCYEYNNDYSTLNDLKSPLPNNPFITALNAYYYRIIRSIKTNRESNYVGWRNILVDDYYEMPKDTGQFKNVKSLGRTVLLQMERALYTATIKDVINANNVQAYLGRGDIFDREPLELYDDQHGKIGCFSKFGCAITPIGYVVIDTNKIYLYDGESVTTLNNELDEFFINYLDNFTTSNKNNPFIRSGLIVSYNTNPKDNILLITKRDLGGKEFTISFNIANKNWYSYHDYIPDYMFSLREKMYSIRNAFSPLTITRVYKHNHTNKSTFYILTDAVTPPAVPVQVVYPSYCDVLINNTNDLMLLLESLNWETDYYNRGVENYNKSITHIMLYNESQCTGLLPLSYGVEYYQYAENARLIHKTWHYSKFRDYVLNNLLAFLDADGNVLTSNVNKILKDYFDRSEFISNFIVIRLYYDNVDQAELFIKDVNAKFKKDRR